MNQQITYKENTFYHLANKYKDQIIDEEEIIKKDMTKTFYEELEYMIKNGEIIIININAKMRLGKSTQAIKLGQQIHKILEETKQTTKKFTIKNIARDQQEHSKQMRDPEIHHTVIVTDESNELENTGVNVTIEHAMAKVFSDVQAGRYVHRVCCSPKASVDANADILLQITSIDKHTMTTFNKLYYKYYEGGIERIQPIGHVKIYVGDLIKIWEEKSKKLFFKHPKTEKDKKELEKLAKKDLYTDYQIKKYEKMELITKEGILVPRMLDTASITLKIVKELRDLTRIMKIQPTLIRSHIKEETRKNKIPMSIVGEELAVKDVMGVINTYQEINNIQKKINQLENKYKTKKIDHISYELEKEVIEKAHHQLIQMAKNQITELEHYEKINKKYNQIK